MDDYISREPMIREMQQLYEGVPYNFPNSTHTEWEILRGKYAAFIDYLKQQPAADVQPVKHGRWETWGYVFHGIEWKRCSVCGKTADVSYIALLEGRIEPVTLSLCGCCGARMDGEQNA